jgi:hypothetical protein
VINDCNMFQMSKRDVLRASEIASAAAPLSSRANSPQPTARDMNELSDRPLHQIRGLAQAEPPLEGAQ